MICSKCGKTVKTLQNYGNDEHPFCYECKIVYDQEQKKLEEEHLELLRLQREKVLIDGACRYHPTEPAVTHCSVCGVSLCLTCSADDLNAMSVCLKCRSGENASFEIPLPNVYCTNHPVIPAQYQCYHCNTPICTTCAFSYPGDIHLCPLCVQKKPSELNPKIKKNTYISLGTVIVSFISLVVLSIAGTDVGDDPTSTLVLGFGIILFSLIPAIIGCTIGFSTMPRNSKKPFLLKLSIIGNICMLALIGLLIIIGNLSE